MTNILVEGREQVELADIGLQAERAKKILAKVRKAMLAPNVQKEAPHFSPAQLGSLVNLDTRQIDYRAKKGGTLPAGGSEIPTFLSYLVEKRLSKHPEEFGNGAIDYFTNLGEVEVEGELQPGRGDPRRREDASTKVVAICEHTEVPRRVNMRGRHEGAQAGEEPVGRHVGVGGPGQGGQGEQENR